MSMSIKEYHENCTNVNSLNTSEGTLFAKLGNIPRGDTSKVLELKASASHAHNNGGSPVVSGAGRRWWVAEDATETIGFLQGKRRGLSTALASLFISPCGSMAYKDSVALTFLGTNYAPTPGVQHG